MTETLERILYVEDEPDIQEIARVSLETVGGFTVATCSSGREALDRAEEFEPDLLLLDVMMPDMDGPTTLGELRKLPGFGSTPTIFMTAKVQAHEIEDALRSVAAARSMNGRAYPQHQRLGTRPMKNSNAARRSQRHSSSTSRSSTLCSG